MNQNVTIVTGLWDLGRGNLEGFGRGFDHYLKKFEELLRTDARMYIHIPSSLEEWVWERRNKENTRIRIIEVEDFKNWFAFYHKTNEIRQNPEWYNFSGWLPDAPQTKLEFYNPVVMSKMFMLNDASIFNPFGTDYFFWIDGGITNTVHPGYFYHDKVFDNLPYYYELENKFLYLKYPYEGYTEVHGFHKGGMEKYCGTEPTYVCRGGFFGGRVDHLHEINSLYYNYLQSSLNEGYMGTEESIFTILSHRHPELTHCHQLEGNGLVWPFFEELKYIKQVAKVSPNTGKKPFSETKMSVYAITFNIPDQFEALCKSFEEVDRNFIDKPHRKIVLNNSTDRSTDERYEELFKKYGWEEIRKEENIGIHGGRIFIAEHFDESDSDFYIFFEDDMLLAREHEGKDKFGFPKHIPNLYNKLHKLIHEEDFDFIKTTFCELYGDNSQAWSWYNLPREVRYEYFPHKPQLPVQGLDPNPPRTDFKHIYFKDGVPYISGEVHVCNWPIVFTREGNRKIYLDIKWAHPFEATTMSHAFQEQKKGNIKGAVLLASPITHNRIEYYKGTERKEN